VTSEELVTGMVEGLTADVAPTARGWVAGTEVVPVEPLAIPATAHFLGATVRNNRRAIFRPSLRTRNRVETLHGNHLLSQVEKLCILFSTCRKESLLDSQKKYFPAGPPILCPVHPLLQNESLCQN